VLSVAGIEDAAMSASDIDLQSVLQRHQRIALMFSGGKDFIAYLALAPGLP
jgi:PP-loop superfamily ATP-utilizing enzyme